MWILKIQENTKQLKKTLWVEYKYTQRNKYLHINTYIKWALKNSNVFSTNIFCLELNSLLLTLVTFNILILGFL